MKKLNFIITACLLMGATFSYAQNTWDGTSTSTTTSNGVVTIGVNNPTNYSLTPTTKLKVIENNPFIQLKDSTPDPLPAARPTGCGIRLTSYNNSFEIKSYTNSLLGQGLFIHNPASTSNLGLTIYDSRIFLGSVALSGAPLASKFGDVNITANASASRFTVHGNNFSAPVLDANYNFGAYGNALFSNSVLIGANRTTAPAFPLEVVGEVASIGNNNGFRVASTQVDKISAAPWYGMGLSNTTLSGESGTAVQVAGYFGVTFRTRATQSAGVDMSIQNGKVMIGNVAGNSNTLDYKLFVEKGIITEKVKVALVADWADYVFAKNYKLRPLSEVEAFINENQHLPEIPSAEEVSKNGLDLVEMDTKLLQKVEELTLYMIELKKENESLKKRLEVVESNQ